MLRARRTLSIKQKFITASLMVFALVAQPFVALDLPKAFAASDASGTLTLSVLPNASVGEWVKVSYSGVGTLDLSGWKLSDTQASRSVRYTFASGKTLTSGQEILLCGDTSKVAGCAEEYKYSGGNTVWNNASDAAVLTDSGTTDVVTMIWTTAPATDVVVSNSAAVDYSSVPASVVNISSVAELRSAIENQADGQTWNIAAGQYGLAPFTTITTQGQTGWYFPVTANNLTINGIGNPTIYGTGYSVNGNWATQNLVSVFGDNVTIDGFTFMPKVEPNKTIEVLGSDFTLRNTVITPNTLTDQSEYDNISDPTDPAWTQDAKQWGGSLYFSHAGNHTVQNVIIHNAGISFRYSPSGTHVSFDNVQIVDTTGVDWINNYRYSSGFNNSGNSITGAPKITYHVTNNLNNFQMVLDIAKSGDVIEVDSDITIAQELNVNNDGVVINGNNHTISAGFNKTSNSNNSVLGIKSDSVVVNNLLVDAGSAINNLHGINIYQASNVALNNITAINGNTGVVVNGSTVAIDGIHTSGNRWHGVNVDKAGAELTIKGTNSHDEAVDLYADDRSVGKVNDTNNQYAFRDDVKISGDRAYNIKLTAPTTPYPANNSSIKTNDFWFTWSTVSGAASYEWQGSQSNVRNSEGNLQNVMWTGDYQKIQPTTPTAHSVGASGTWYWQVRAVDPAGVKGPWSSVWAMTVDLTPPTIPSISIPSNEQYFKTTPITNSWTASTDASGIAKYQVEYIYDDGHTFSGGPYRDVPGSTTSRSHAPALTEQGGVTIRVRAVDNAGNVSAWSAPVHYYYDATNPSSSDDLGTLVSGTATIAQHVNDNIAAKSGKLRIWKLTSLGVSDDSKFYAIGNVNVDANGDVRYSLDTGSKLFGDGQYIAKFTATDRAGNSIVTQKYFTVDNEAPVVSGVVEGVSYHGAVSVLVKDANFKELDVNGSVIPVSSVTTGEVDTYTATISADGTYTLKAIDEAGNTTTVQFVIDSTIATTIESANTNTATPTLGGIATYSVDGAPVANAELLVVVDSTSYTVMTDADGKWSLALSAVTNGSHTVNVYTDSTKVTKVGSDSFVTVIPVITSPTENTPSPEISRTITGTSATTTISNVNTDTNANTNANIDTNVDTTETTPTDDTAILGAEDTKSDTTSNQTTTESSDKSDEWSFLGLVWHWWVLVIAAILALWWFMVAWRRYRQNNNKA